MSLRKDTELPHGLSYDDLPAWMRRTRREVDSAGIVVALLCLVIAAPFLLRSNLPYNAGTQMQLARTIEMGASIDAGVLYPRWAPDFHYGYGSPLWNYLAPLPHYLGGLHLVISEGSPQDSVRVMFAASLVLCGLGMFGFVRRRWGSTAALLATAVFLLSPQIALVRPYLEGDLPGLLALGLFLLCCWAFDRLLHGARGWGFAGAVIALGLLWLAARPLSALLAIVLVGWLVVRAVLGPAHLIHRWRPLLAFALGSLLAAFFWLPAWWERAAVQWIGTSAQPAPGQMTLTPAQLLAQPPLLDRNMANPAPTPALGTALWVLALLGVLASARWYWLRTPRDPRPVPRGEALQRRVSLFLRQMPGEQWELLYFSGVGLLLFGMVTPPAAPLWDRLPAWPPFGPRDVLPVIAACAAMAAGRWGWFLDQQPRWRWAIPTLVETLVLVLLTSLPVLAVPHWPRTEVAQDLFGLVREEARGYLIASQTEGWLLPAAVGEIPKPSNALIASYESDLVDKVERDTLPAAAQADVVVHRGQSDRLVVETRGPLTLTLLTFNFPGWNAQIDNRPARLQTQGTTGLIEIPVPAGRHEILVHFGTTLARRAGWLISGLALGLTAAIGMRLEHRAPRGRGVPAEEETAIPNPHPVVLAAAALLFSLGAVLAWGAADVITVQSGHGFVEQAEFQLPRALQGGIDLLAYDVDPSARAGGVIHVTLYWRAVRPDLPDYQATASLVSPDDSARVASFAQHRHPGMIPSSQWSSWPLLDFFVRDDYNLALDAAAPPGRYQIVVQVGRCSQSNLFPCQTVEPLFVRDGRGSSLGQRIILPTVIEVNP